jgi:hypothetical protein
MAEERMQSEGFYEMLWDCDHCDAKGLLGKSQRHCPECGAPQNPDKRYFPKEGDQRRVDGHQYVGSDRHCPACNTPQSAKGSNCAHCGAPLDGSKEVRGVAAPVAPAPAKRKRPWLWIIVILAVVASGFGIWWRCIRTRQVEMTLASHRWERAIAVDEYADKLESDWRDRMPSDAGLASCHRKERSTRKIQDGEDCHTERKDKKDGTFEQVKKCTPKYRSEPVDDDWCTYTLRRWRQVDVIKTSGTGMSPAWPSAGLPPATAAASLGARRQGKRTETLILDFGGQSCDVPDASWRKYSDGKKVKVEVRASSGDLVCSSL